MHPTCSPLTRATMVCLLLAVAGCGGGGDNTSQPGVPAPVPGPVPPPMAGPNDGDHALVTNPPAPSYGTGSTQGAIYSVLENARMGAGVGGLADNARLDQMAANHLQYMTQNFPAFGHTETSGQPGFTGATPADRAAAVSYSYASLGEVLSESSVDDPGGCIANLLDTVYHQALLMGGYREVGIAYGAVGSGTFACVLDLGVPSGSALQLPNGGVASTYPYDGAVGVPTTFQPSTEGPNPMPDYGSNPAGQPILASMLNYDSRALLNAPTSFTVNQFVLTDAGGQAVPARLIAASGTLAGPNVNLTVDAANELPAGMIYLVPLAPLSAGSLYTVRFAGTAGDEVLSRQWSFSTR